MSCMPLQKIFDKLSVSEISFRDITCESTCCTCPRASMDDMPKKARAYKTRKKPLPEPSSMTKIAIGVPADRPEAATAPSQQPHNNPTEREFGCQFANIKCNLALTKSNSF